LPLHNAELDGMGVFDYPVEEFMRTSGKMFLVYPIVLAIVVAMLSIGMLSTAWAQQPRPLFEPLRNLGDSIRNIGNNRTVEADPNQEYRLTEADGPYLIMATALSGPTARQDAHALVLELRSRHRWHAYVYEKDFSSEANRVLAQTRGRLNRPPETQFAVLIGNFSSLEDNQFRRTLEEVRRTQPEALRGRTSAAAFSFPMAFGMANPMLPTEHQRGTVDAFVESINRDSPYSLLRNPRRYTVQIATFTGRGIMGAAEIRAVESGRHAFDQEESALEIGARAAAELCRILRERGVEAYEFHDRFSSIVTVGSFDQAGRRLPDGTMVPDPHIQQIIQQFQGQVINGIQCSPQPRLIEVPRVARR